MGDNVFVLGVTGVVDSPIKNAGRKFAFPDIDGGLPANGLSVIGSMSKAYIDFAFLSVIQRQHGRASIAQRKKEQELHIYFTAQHNLEMLSSKTAFF